MKRRFGKNAYFSGQVKRLKIATKIKTTILVCEIECLIGDLTDMNTLKPCI